MDFTVPSGTLGSVVVAVSFVDGRPDATCDHFACSAFEYTTLTGPATVLSGPTPQTFSTISAPLIKLGVSNFLAVSNASEISIRCNNVSLTLAQAGFVSSGQESYFEFQLPEQLPGLKQCVLEQGWQGATNPANFNLIISEPQVTVQEFYPAELVPTEVLTVKISNVLPEDVQLVYQTTTDGWQQLTLTSSSYVGRLSQDAEGLWESGTLLQFEMIDTVTNASSPVTIGVRQPSSGSTNVDEFSVLVLKNQPQLITVSPLFDSLCGGATITAQIANAQDTFSVKGLTLSFYEIGGHAEQVAAAMTWNALTGQATFEVPVSTSSSSLLRQVQLHHSSSDAQYSSANYTFTYFVQQPVINKMSIGVGKYKTEVDTSSFSIVPSRRASISLSVQDWNVRSIDDLSLTLSRGGSSISLSASAFTSRCQATGCECDVVFSMPQDANSGLHVLQLNSKRCPASQILLNANMLDSKAVPRPERVPESGNDVAVYLENAPHSTESSFKQGNVAAMCNNSEVSVLSVAVWHPDETLVRLRAAGSVIPDGHNEAVVSCRIYRRDDATRSGPVFSLAYYRSNFPFVRHAPSQAEALGNQFGGKLLSVQIANFPTISLSSDLVVKFGSRIASNVWFDRLTAEGDTVVKMTSLAVHDAAAIADTPIQTVRVSHQTNPEHYVEFEFTYCWAQGPAILDISRATGDMDGGTELVLQLADIPFNSIADDVFVIFQQRVVHQCATLQKVLQSDNSAAWYCTVTIPRYSGLARSSGADPFGLQVYTAQQGRSKKVALSFTFVESSIPQYESQDSVEGPLSGSRIRLTFINYCHDLSLNEYAVTFSTATDSLMTGQVLSQTFSNTSKGCSITLTITAPTMEAAFDSTGTMIPAGQAAKSVSFAFEFLDRLLVKPSVAGMKHVYSSVPEMGLTVSNLRSVTTGELCDGSSCSADHNMQVSFGAIGSVLLEGPSSCVLGECKLKAQPIAPLVSVGLTTVTVTNHGSYVASFASTAEFEMEVFEYSCEAYCLSQGKIQDEVEIQSVPPASQICRDRYCKEKPNRNPLITYVSPSSCAHVESCEIRLIAWQITAETLTQDALANQLIVAFGNQLEATEASSIELIRQQGDKVELAITTPRIPSAMVADVIIRGYDESKEVLQAVDLEAFKFRAVASGPIELVSAFPLSSVAIGANTVATLHISNFPSDIPITDIQSSIGGVSAEIASLSISENFLAKILVAVPDHTTCSSAACVVPAFISVSSRNLFTQVFNFTYIRRLPPIINGFFPQSASVLGGQQVTFDVANLATGPSGYYNASMLVFEFGTVQVVAVSAAQPNAQGIVAVTVIAPPLAAGSVPVTLIVNDRELSDAPQDFEYFDDSPFIEDVTPSEATAGQSTGFEVHVGNQGLPAQVSTIVVHLCGLAYTVTPESKGANAMKLKFNSEGCLGEQSFELSIDGTSLGSQASGTILFTQPAPQVTPVAVTVAGWHAVEIAMFGLEQVVNVSDINVVLSSTPSSVLAVTHILSSVAGGWTRITAEAPAASAAQIYTGTIGHVSNLLYNQSFSIEYLNTPIVSTLVPSGSYTTERPIVRFNLNHFAVTEDKSSFKCVIGAAELDVLAVVVYSFAERKMGATLKLPRHVCHIAAHCTVKHSKLQ